MGKRGGKVRYLFTEGQRFGRWLLLSFSHKDRWGTPFWLCRCLCGQERAVSTRLLRSGDSQSCGCLQKECVTKLCTKHGMFKTSIYKSWSGMLNRCKEAVPERIRRSYFDRDITVCEAWKSSFDAFFSDMGFPPNDGNKYELDRINNDKGYCKENCRWVTHKINCDNRRTGRKVEIDGVVHTINEWSLISGIPADIIRARLKINWTTKQAVWAEIVNQKEPIRDEFGRFIRQREVCGGGNVNGI